ncbi:MAG: undecaprenyl/decaprenyl-phosphate alpha-N-acetylglucosaminyl 1-phosphate transferase [Candidatus Omnitrophica bacterium]|nr:undecaprenyl/decaprenyl-phosphate alpha-N-acetylglucosaminyl 1-phosphate transferase [Candidatus Omnitrophota bacterium]
MGLFFVFLFKKLAFKYNLLISQGIPLIGGISIGLSFSIACLLGFFLYGGFLREAIGLIIAAIIILIFGVIDDRRELSIIAKFLVQIVATTLLIFFGVKTQIVYIGNPFNIIITFIWVIGIANAFNHLDVIDGLAAGVAMIVSFAFFIISFLNGDINTAVLSLALAAAALSFLFYNFPPAKIYMGNSGSHFLGFVIAAIALMVRYAPLERKVALLSPLIILGLPIFDTTFLILIRMIKKRIPFKKSDDHIALILLKLGYSKRKALLSILTLCLFFSVCGIAVSRVSNFFGMIIIAFALAISLTLTIRIGKIFRYG